MIPTRATGPRTFNSPRRTMLEAQSGTLVRSIFFGSSRNIGDPETEKKRGGSGATREGVVPARSWPPAERTFSSGVKKRFRAGKISDRPWAEGFATGSTASGILHRQLASSAYGRSEVLPPMNRRNPAPRWMVHCYGSRCGARGRDYPLNRLFSWPGGRTMPSGMISGDAILNPRPK